MAKFDVDVSGVTYEVDAPDEKTAWKWANATHAKSAAPKPLQPPEKMSLLEELLAKAPDKIPLPFVANGGVDRQQLVDLAGGASSLLRGGLNLANKGTDALGLTGNNLSDQIAPGKKLGDRVFPKEVTNDSASRLVGEFMDPVGLAIGGGVGKMLPYAQVFGNGIVNALKATGKNVTGGAIAGSGIGALSDDGSALGGAAAGAGIMGALPVAAKVAAAPAKWAYGAAEPWLENGPANIYRRWVNENAGSAKDRIAAAVQNAKELVPGSKPTVGEAIADIPEATVLAAHQADIAKKSSVSPKFQARKAEQEAARQEALGEFAKTPEALEEAQKFRAKAASENYGDINSTLVDPKSQAQLWEDAISRRQASKASALQDKGRFQTYAAENEVRGENYVPVPGMPRVSGRASVFPELADRGKVAAGEADSIYAGRRGEEETLRWALQKLKDTVGVDEKSLTPLLDRPSMQSALKEAIKGAQETGGYFPKSGEDKFSIGNLQRMKQALDDILKSPADFGIKGTEAVEVGKTRDSFVNWLSNRSPEWKKARLSYAENSKPINQMQVGQYLEDKLRSATEKETPGVFAQAMRDAPGTIKRSGSGRSFDNLADVLEPKNEAVANAVLEDVVRKGKYEQLARGTSLGEDTAGASGAQKIPSMLSRTAMVANYILHRGQEGVNKKINNIAGEAYLDPEKFAALLKDVPKSKQREVIDALIQSGRYPALGSAVEGSQ